MPLRANFALPLSLAFAASLPLAAFAQSQTESSVYIAETFDDWAIQCRSVEDATDPCRMLQAVMDVDGNQVSQVTVQALPPGQEAAASISFAAPLDTYLPAGMTIRVDDGQSLQIPFEYCSTTGCFARIIITDDQLDGFIMGGRLFMSLVPLANRTTVVEVVASLKGFTAGFEQLEFQLVTE